MTKRYNTHTTLQGKLESGIRPVRMVKTLGEIYPKAWEMINNIAKMRNDGQMQWDPHCYIPLAAVSSLFPIVKPISETKKLRHSLELFHSAYWRLHKEMFIIDPDLEKKLIEQKLDPDLPSKILLNLPYKSLYVRTTSMRLSDQFDIDGFFLAYDWLQKSQSLKLRVYVLTELREPIMIIYTINDNTIQVNTEEFFNSIYVE